MSKFVEFKITHTTKNDFLCFNAFEISCFRSVQIEGKGYVDIWLSGISDNFVVAETYDYVFKEIKEAIA